MTRAKTPAQAPTRATPEQYARALQLAKSKAVHVAPPGSLELSARSGWYESAAEGDCGRLAERPSSGRYSYRGQLDDEAAQLRSVYARLTVGAVKNQWGDTRTAGKPKWVPVGVSCLKCGAFWAAPND